MYRMMILLIFNVVVLQMVASSVRAVLARGVNASRAYDLMMLSMMACDGIDGAI